MSTTTHVTYPHEPGRLFDCPACEAQCHCVKGATECVFEGEHNGSADDDRRVNMATRMVALPDRTIDTVPFFVGDYYPGKRLAAHEGHTQTTMIEDIDRGITTYVVNLWTDTERTELIATGSSTEDYETAWRLMLGLLFEQSDRAGLALRLESVAGAFV